MARKIRYLVIGDLGTAPHGPTFRITGRCLDGPILVGDHFQGVERRGEVEPVDLLVDEIAAYGKLLSQLDPVVTGELVLSGDLRRPLADRSVLIGDVPSG